MEDEDFDCSFTEDDPSILNETVVSEIGEENLSHFSFSSDVLSELDKSFSPSKAPQSTPNKEKRKGRGKGKNTEKSCAVPVFKPPPPVSQFKCHLCGRYMKNFGGLNLHVLSHKWKDLATKQPSKPDIKTHCLESSSNVLKLIAETKFAGPNGEILRNYSKDILENRIDSEEWKQLQCKLCDAIVDGVSKLSVQKKGMTFASAARSQSQLTISTLMGSKDFRDDTIEMLMRVSLCKVEVAFPFILDYLRKLNDCALSFIYCSLSGRLPADCNDDRRSRSKEDFNHHFSHQRIHYISGSAARSIIRHAYRYPSNARLQRRKECVKTKLSVMGAKVVCSPNDKAYWTKLMNRKNLIFINDEAFVFFLEIAKVLQQMEKGDGGLGHEAVLEKVIATPTILSVWDKVIDCNLCEEESFDLMVKLIRLVTNTFGKGILLRRLNTRWKKGKGKKDSVAVSHRAKVLMKN